MPGQTGVAWLEGLATGHAWPKPGLLRMIFLCFFICLLLLVSAVAGSTIGATTTGAYIASVKIQIGNLPMGLSWGFLRPVSQEMRQDSIFAIFAYI
jgi:hypothetical protein